MREMDGATESQIELRRAEIASVRPAAGGRCETRATLPRPQHDDDRARLHAAVEIDHVLIGEADAARRNGVSDPSRLVGAMDAVERVLAAGIEIERARTHRIARAAFDVARERAEPPPLVLGRRPPRPFFLAADRRHAGPSLAGLAHDGAIA